MFSDRHYYIITWILIISALIDSHITSSALKNECEDVRVKTHDNLQKVSLCNCDKDIRPGNTSDKNIPKLRFWINPLLVNFVRSYSH